MVGVMALLTALSLPAVRTFFSSMATAGNTRSLISAALSSARAIAAKEQRYAGIRFQKDIYGHQYIIFIVYDFDKTGLENGFRAVEGIQPIRLSDDVGIMDLMIVERIYVGIILRLTDKVIDKDTMISSQRDLTDATSFSIIFSPSGKLVMHEVQVRNRDGIPDSTGELNKNSYDDVFNKKVRVDTGLAMFYQDDYFDASWSPYAGSDFGLGPELSRNSFIIYDKTEFNKIDINKRWTNCLAQLAQKRIYISPYTGTIVNSGQ